MTTGPHCPCVHFGHPCCNCGKHASPDCLACRGQPNGLDPLDEAREDARITTAIRNVLNTTDGPYDKADRILQHLRLAGYRVTKETRP